MFNEKTVIILGAGASWHYGYPTGETLIENLINTTKEIADVYSEQSTNNYCLPYLGFIEALSGNAHPAVMQAKLVEVLEKFYTRLQSFDPVMIDSFLNDNQTLREIGKTMIAYEILKLEKDYSYSSRNANRLKEYNHRKSLVSNGLILEYEDCGFKDNWYRYLVDAIISGCSDSHDLLQNINNLHIVTFNYDVSLEHYLYTRLSCIDRFEKHHIDRFLTGDLVTHVYGKIRQDCFEQEKYGAIFNQIKEKDTRLSTSKFESYKHRLELACGASKTLEVIDKEKFINQQNANHLVLTRKKIEEATKVFILGFGFYEDNINLLELQKFLAPPSSPGTHKKIFYTNYTDTRKIETKASQFFTTTSGWDTRKIEKSTRNVYDALAYDFDFI